MAKLRISRDLVVAGDGRHDSMGHSAKFCAYTITCCTVPYITDFRLAHVSFTDIFFHQLLQMENASLVNMHFFIREMKLAAVLEWSFMLF